MVSTRRDGAQQGGWWLAPDGEWYPPEQYEYWRSLQPRHLVEPPLSPIDLLAPMSDQDGDRRPLPGQGDSGGTDATAG